MPTAASPPGALLTVAVPTCNGAAHVGEALRSIRAQAGVAFELVVYDDRSDDDTLDVVRAVASDRARIEVNSQRLGLAGNWNRCAQLARTPFVAIFHQDDVMRPGHLAAHLAAFTSDDSLGLVASAADVIDARGQPVPATVVEPGGLGSVDRLYEPDQLAGAMAAGNPLRCSAVTIRVTTFADLGGFDPSYHYVVDWDFWLRVSRKWRVAWLARPTVQVRWHPRSEAHRFHTGTADLDETARLLEQLFSLDWKDRPDVVQLRNTANARLGRAFLNRAHDALRAGRAELARHALRSGLKRSPGLLKSILSDPRLCIQMAALAAAPQLAARIFARGN
jgi:glycosyltransferase involved in cell wall biosynthesis